MIPRLIVRPIIAVVSSFFLLSELRADEIQRNFQTARMAGRGGTYVAAPETDHSARFNAATLAQSPHLFQIRLLEFNGIVSRNLVNTISDFTGNDVSDDDESGPFISILDKLDERFGQRHGFRGEIIPMAIRLGPVELMPFLSNQSYFESRRPSTPLLDLKTDSRAGVLIATGLSVTESIDLGVGVRPTHRWVIGGAMALTDILDLSEEGREFADYGESSYGFGIGVDLSAVWRPAENWRFALLIEDVGDTSSFEGDNTPRAVKQKVSTGLWYRLEMDAGWRLDWSFDWQDLVNPHGYHHLRHIYSGLELGRSLYSGNDNDVGFLLGVHQGYLTWGAYFDAWFFRAELSQFTTELADLPGQRPDKRYAMTLSTSFSF